MTEQTISTGLFQGLGPMLANRAVMITVSNGGNGMLTVNIIPKKITSDDDNDALTAPLCVTGTAEELDRDLARQVRDFAEAQATTSSNLAQVKKDLEAAEKAAREEAKKTAKGKAVPPAAAEKKADDPPRASEPPQMMSLFESEVTQSADANQASTNTSNQPVVD